MLRPGAAVGSQFEHEKEQQAAVSSKMHLQHCLNFILHLEIRAVFFSKRSGSTAELLCLFAVLMMGPSQTNF
jgi:hypothetical protein